MQPSDCIPHEISNTYKIKYSDTLNKEILVDGAEMQEGGIHYFMVKFHCSTIIFHLILL